MAGVKLSQEGYNYLETIMAELEMERSDRPDALKIAFSKGIVANTLPTEEKKELSKFEFPISVIAKGDELLLAKHLIIERLQRKVDNYEFEKYILLFVEHGLKIMFSEIQELSSADNYLFYLMEKHGFS
ncbi:hypothetical protein [Bacillus kexueae]|uniref:hypothetical protein n=1 Tax=Aeribacillus kexueae TaxID=2078952 RepID=UPI001FAE9189|nr:hypothetical protein [Bacillus kexueae]